MTKEEAIDVLKHNYPSACFTDLCEAVEIAIQALSAQPEQRWIPMTEQLPKNGHYYLWCSDAGSVQMDYYFDGFEHGQEYGYNIVAWMPRPKPWKGEDDAEVH